MSERCGICGKTAKQHERKAVRVACVDLWIKQMQAEGKIASGP